MTLGADRSDVAARRTTPDQLTPTVELIEITKAFPGVIANDHISLVAMPGEVLCLLGENGAGKSTLMSIISGLYQPDSGRIKVGGDEVRIHSPRHGRELGVGMVYQHLSLIPSLTVLENLMMGANPGIVLDQSSARTRLAGLASALGVAVDPGARAGSLALGQQQHIEIIKALWSGSRLLILDEPTSMLTPQGAMELQGVLRALTARGLAIIFITHKLHEAIAIGDRVAVLKLGRVVGTMGPDELVAATPQELQERIITMMFGEAHAPDAQVAELREPAVAGRAAAVVTAEPLLELVDVSAAGADGQHGIQHVSLTVRGGEVVGVAGIDGNGQRAFAEVIAGQPRQSAGEIRLAGTSIDRTSVSARQRMGLRYVTDDRIGEGVVASWPVSINLVLKRIGQTPYWNRGTVDRIAIDTTARELIEEFDIRTPSPQTRIGKLSGGNIQKAIIAREVAFEPRVVVFNKPTHGLDVRTTHAVRERISEMTRRGVAVVVISSDLDELIDVCDRVAVLDAGRLVGIVKNGPGAATRIGELIVGAAAPVPMPA
ncbi:MAG: ABC transporter ATP-binding protein [Chloroflexi bacterium]|nr:ABC transporter ATP-binding protein [Chloroflexota bacterium]